ncbi:MAG: hypothetical protein WC734_01685 [Patescibacteria group bacterium]|jgi:hypothetical protein
MFLSDTLIQVAAVGGGLIIDLDKDIFLADTLIRIASAANASGATIVIRNADKHLLSDSLIRIGAAGGGRVIFEV